MKRITFLLIILLMLTGCSVEYNLNITKDNIYENINVITENQSESNIINNYRKPIEAFLDSPMYSESTEKLPDVEYYTTSKYLNNGLYTLNINYNFGYEEFVNSNIINHSVSVVKIEEKRGVYTFNTGATVKIFDSYDINTLNVKITLDDELELINTNASTINGNEYNWTITRDNYKTSPITLSYKEKEEDKPIEEPSTTPNEDNPNANENPSVNETNDILLVFIGFIGFIVVLVLILVFSKKIRK